MRRCSATKDEDQLKPEAENLQRSRTSALVSIERPEGGYRDRYRSYEAIVNGQKRAEIWRGEKKRIEVDPGPVQVYMKIDSGKSRVVELTLQPGDEAKLRCRPRSAFTALWGITFGRNNYVRLERI